MPQDNFRKLYENVKQGYDLPDYDTFKKDMENEDNLRKFHTNLEKEYELPDFDTFKSDMGLKKKETFGLGFGTASEASASTKPQVKAPLKSTSVSALEGIKGVKGDKPKTVVRPKSIVPIKEQEALPTENVPYKEDLQKRINVLNDKFGTTYDVEGALAEMDAPDIGTAEAAGRGFLSGVNSIFAATLNTPEYLRRVLTNPILELAGMDDESKKLFYDVQADNPMDALYAFNKISDIYKKDSEALVKPLEGKFDKDFMAQYEEGDYIGAAKQIGVDLAKSVPATMAIAMATASGVPLSALTPAGSLVFGSQQYQEIDPNSPMTENQKQTNSYLKGFAEQLFESLGTSQITKQVASLIKKEGAEKARVILGNQYLTAIKESLKPYIALTAPLQEGLTEGVTALTQNVIDKYTDPSKKDINILQDVPKSFLMGAAMGTAFGAAPTIVNTAYSIKGKAAAKEAQEKISSIEQDLDNPNLGDNAKKILVEERAKALIEVNNVLEQEVEAVANLPEQQKEAVIEAQNQIADIDKALADETVSEPTKAALEEKKTQIEQEIDAIITEQETEEAPSSEAVADTIVSDGSATPTTVESTEVAPEVVSETVSEIEPPVVEQTTTDVGGVTAPDVSEALKNVESTAKALEGVDVSEIEKIVGIEKDEFGFVKYELNEDAEIEKLSKEIPKKTVWLARSKNTGFGIDVSEKLEYKNGKWNVGVNEFDTPYDAAWFLRKNQMAIVGEDKPSNEQGIKAYDKEYGYGSEKIGDLSKRVEANKLSEAYHRAKADGSNPELVSAVEQLLGAETKPSESTRKSENLAVSDDVAMFEQVLTINDTIKLKSGKKAKIKEVIESKSDNDIISYIAENIDDIKAQLRDKVGLTTECKW